MLETLRRSIPVLLLVFVSAAVYSNTLHNAYQLDDAYRIKANPHLERVWPPWRHFLDPGTSSTLPTLVHYRPLLPLTLSLNHGVSDALGIERLVGLHVGNITIHLLTSVLLFWLFRELLALAEPSSSMESSRRSLAAFFGSLLWAVHPVSGIPVNYLSARDLLLMQLFLVAALLVWVRMRVRGESNLRWFGVGILGTLSLLSKENGVTVVPLIVLLELLLLKGKSFRGPVFWWIGAGGLALGIYVLATGMRFLEWISPSYGQMQLKVHLSYLKNVVWPFETRMLAHVPAVQTWLEPALLAGLAVIVVSLYLAWCWRIRKPLFSFCIVRSLSTTLRHSPVGFTEQGLLSSPRLAG